jgi:hypothetical protein
MLEKVKTGLSSLVEKFKSATLVEKLVYVAFGALLLATACLVCC